MTRILTPCRVLLPLAILILSGSRLSAAGCTGDPGCYTFAYIPDAQFVHNYPNLAAFITARKSTWNVLAVFNGGDVVNDGTDAQAYFSARVPAAYKAFTAAGLPWYTIPGNHDYCNCSGPGPNNIANRILSSFWRNGNPGDPGLFAPDHRTDTHWAHGTDGANVIAELAISPARRVLFVMLEFFPRSAVLDWAQGVVLSHPFHEVIFLTHAWATDTGRLYTAGTAWDPANYGLSGPPDSNTAQQMWDGWLVNWPNLRMIWSGHFIAASWHNPDGDNFSIGPSPYYWNGRIVPNAAGKLVHQFFNNYQDIDGGAVQIPASGFTPADVDHVTFIRFPSTGGYELYDWSTATGATERLAPMYARPTYDHIHHVEPAPATRAPVGR